MASGSVRLPAASVAGFTAAVGHQVDVLNGDDRVAAAARTAAWLEAATKAVPFGTLAVDVHDGTAGWSTAGATLVDAAGLLTGAFAARGAGALRGASAAARAEARAAAATRLGFLDSGVYGQTRLPSVVYGEQVLYSAGIRQSRALALVEEGAKASKVQLGDFVDDVVFTTGRDPWFGVINGRRTIAISDRILRRERAQQLVAAVHEITHARQSARFGHAAFESIYKTNRRFFEIRTEIRALKLVDKYLGGLSSSEAAASTRYLNFWYRQPLPW